jgi:hypothetical protein
MPSTKRVQVTDRLPPKGQWVIAVTPAYRCLAYVDQRGQWRDVARSREIPDVKEWCPEEDERIA